MIKKYTIYLAILLGVLFQGCSNNKEKSNNANDMISTKEYVLDGIDKKHYTVKKQGDGFSLEGAKDKVIIFDIFATWCPPCRAAATHLSSLQEKYKDDLVVIGITIEDNISDEKLKEFADTYKAKYALVNSKQNRLLSNDIVKELNLGERYPIPLMVLYKDGKLINYFVGATQEEFIDSDIRNALGK